MLMTDKLMMDPIYPLSSPETSSSKAKKALVILVKTPSDSDFKISHFLQPQRQPENLLQLKEMETEALSIRHIARKPAIAAINQ